MKKTIVTEEIDMYLNYLHECGCEKDDEGKVKGTNIIYDDDDEIQNECNECVEEDMLDEEEEVIDEVSPAQLKAAEELIKKRALANKAANIAARAGRDVKPAMGSIGLFSIKR